MFIRIKMAKRKDQWQVYLEKKYKREVLHGATYIDTRQRGHFKKWVKKQMAKL